MITAIRPYTPQTRQNQPNFQRKFETKEITGLFERDSETYNDVMFFIGAKHIKKADGALEQIEKHFDDFFRENPSINRNDEKNTMVRWHKNIVEALNKQK